MKVIVLLIYLNTTLILHIIAQVGLFSGRWWLVLPNMIFQVLRIYFVFFFVSFFGAFRLCLLLVPWTCNFTLVRRTILHGAVTAVGNLNFFCQQVLYSWSDIGPPPLPSDPVTVGDHGDHRD